MNTRYVKLNGKDYPIYFSNFVLAQFGEKHSLAMGELLALFANGLDKIEMMQIYELAFLAFKAGHKQAEKKFPYEDLESFAFEVDKDSEWMEKTFEKFAEFFPEPGKEKQQGKKKPAAAK